MRSRLPEFLPARPRPSAFALVLGTVSIAVAGWTAYEFLTLRSLGNAVEAARSEAAQWKRQLAAQRSAQRAAGPGADIVRRQAQPMMPVLGWLERTWSEDVSYARIDIDANARSQRLELETRNEAALLALIDALAATPGVRSASLVRQQRGSDDEAGGHGGIEATIQLRWEEPSP
ncbi:hypothetical protein [Cupriavidus agavae]|uniref:Uncharacterized protein n=1 Tax=Cupriavidus agavae TaxID=1001822 RepID=A0A4Q7RDL0_9BURK|nr:hypothetical protein [Cupriavidus agavae]RZT31263.1 hypothetical protein EV147_4444 [Cupriavidus agavae]